MYQGQYIVTTIILLTVAWIMYMAWFGLLMMSNRKEKDGFFVDEQPDKDWSRIRSEKQKSAIYDILPLPIFFFSDSFTDKGNKYRVKFIRGLTIGVIGIMCIILLSQAGLLPSANQQTKMYSNKSHQPTPKTGAAVFKR